MPPGSVPNCSIRATVGQLFQAYPKRKILARQPLVRVFGDDLVIYNAYAMMYLTDTTGKVHILPTRTSAVWSKAGGNWQIVDQHNSPLPVER